MNVRVIRMTALGAWLLAGISQAQELPPGYTLVRATQTPENEGTPSINIHSQIVFDMRSGSDNGTLEVYLYDGRTGELTRITDDSVQDVGPQINDDGVITWARGFGPVTPDARWLEIVYRTPDGTITRLSDNEVVDASPAINRFGQIAWQQDNGRGCDADGRHVMFFDGKAVQQITDNDWSNQTIDLNDAGDIIWTEFDFCPGGFNWRSKIKLYRDGVIQTLFNDPDLQSQAADINNTGTCAWSSKDRVTGNKTIYLWNDGVRSVLAEFGSRPKLNDLGDVAFQHADVRYFETWAYFRGEFILLASDPNRHNAEPGINNAREMCWRFGEAPWLDIRFLRRLDAGDLNCDGTVDAFDIEGFLQALFDPENFPADCDPTLADINQDGSVNAFDIESFIGLLFP